MALRGFGIRAAGVKPGECTPLLASVEAGFVPCPLHRRNGDQNLRRTETF